MVKKEVKEAVEKVVEEVKAEDIPVEVVAEKEVSDKTEKKVSDKKLFMHECGQMGHMDDDGNFVPQL